MYTKDHALISIACFAVGILLGTAVFCPGHVFAAGEHELVIEEAPECSFNVYLNGFLIAARDKAIRVNYYLKQGLNTISVDTVRIPDELPPTPITILLRGRESKKQLFSWPVKVDPDIRSYSKELPELQCEVAEMPWEAAEKVPLLSAKDEEEIRSKVIFYRDALMSGKESDIKKALCSHLRPKMEVDAKMMNLDEMMLFKRFWFFYKALWSPGVRKDDETVVVDDNFSIVKSPYDSRILTIRPAKGGPIVRIVSNLQEEDDGIGSDASLNIRALFAMKIDGKWYLY